MIVVNPYGALIADVRHDEVIAVVVSPTVTRYDYYLTDSVGSRQVLCHVTVTNDSSGNFQSAKRANP